MVQINFAKREVQCKLVYYGPGMSGKTTNLEQIHTLAPETMRGDMTTIATDEDRTLFFDFMPLDLGSMGGLRTKFQMYTVPGQVYYNSVRKLVLEGVDGVVFVADSAPDRMEDNIESLKDLDENLKEHGHDLETLPWVMQYNKRDLPDAIPVEDLRVRLNTKRVPDFEAVAVKGTGVMKTLKALSEKVIERLNKEYGGRETSARVATPKPIVVASLPARVAAPPKPEPRPAAVVTAVPSPPKPQPLREKPAASIPVPAPSAPPLAPAAQSFSALLWIVVGVGVAAAAVAAVLLLR